MSTQTLTSFIWKHARSPAGRCLAAVGLASALAGCAGFGVASLPSGEPEAAVLARLGRPTAVMPAADGSHVLEYRNGPFGQTTYFARITADGKLSSYEQVLNSQRFAQIQVNVATKQDVIAIIGHPSDTTFLDLSQLEVWTYPYKENPVADSMMHVHFDRSGVVRRMLNGPDLRRDPLR